MDALIEALAAYRAEAQSAYDAAQLESEDTPHEAGRVAYWAGAHYQDNPYYDSNYRHDDGCQPRAFTEWDDGWMREHRNFNAAEAAGKTRAA